MAEKEEKYIVIKLKDLEKLKEKRFEDKFHPAKQGTHRKMIAGFERTLDELDNQNNYLVVNLDEPYAEPFWQILLAFETLKEKIHDTK